MALPHTQALLLVLGTDTPQQENMLVGRESPTHIRNADRKQVTKSARETPITGERSGRARVGDCNIRPH